MKEQRYLLEQKIQVNINNSLMIPPSLDAENVKDKDLFYKKMFLTKEEMKEKGVDDSFNREEIDKVITKDWKLDYLIPRYSDEYEEVTFICDFHSWIGERPDRIHGNPISKKMKEVLEQFNIFPEKKFYEAKVLFKEIYHEYFVWEMKTNSFNTYVDFEHSTFCELTWEGELGKDIVKVKNINDLRSIEDEKGWDNWIFKRAVMKPEYKSIDCAILTYPYIIIINERLKNALEEANLTGFEITPFPVEFEYL